MKVLDAAKLDSLKVLSMKDQILSLYNWHPGSISVIKNIKNIENIENFLKIFPKSNIKNIPKIYYWAKESIEKFNQILLSAGPSFKQYL